MLFAAAQATLPPLGLYHGKSEGGINPILSIVVKENNLVDFRVDRSGPSPILEAYNVKFTLKQDNAIQFDVADLVEPVKVTNARLGIVSWLGYSTAPDRIQAIFYPDDLAVRVIVSNAAGSAKIMNIRAVYFDDMPVPDLQVTTPTDIETQLKEPSI